MNQLSLMKMLNELSHAEKNKSGDNSMVAFYCPIKLGRHLLSLFEDVPGDNLEPQDFHITIGLIHNHKGNEDKFRRILDRVVAPLKPFPIEIKSFGVFPPNESNDNNYVLYAKPESEELKYIHSVVLDGMKKYGTKIDDGSHDFNPHITIKYCKEEPNIIDKKINAKFTAQTIAFAAGPKRWEIKLG